MKEFDKKRGYYSRTQRGNRTNNYLTFAERTKLQECLEKKMSIKEITHVLCISRSTIYHERMRMGCTKTPYDAKQAQKHAEEAKKSKPRNGLSIELKKDMVSLYKSLKKLKTHIKTSEGKKIYQDCMFYISKFHLDETKFKRTINVQETKKILQLWYNGVPLTQIARDLNRAKSSVWNVIEKNQKQNQKPKEITYYEKLRDKWAE